MKFKSGSSIVGLFYLTGCLLIASVLISDIWNGFQWNIGTTIATILLAVGITFSIRELLWNFRGYYEIRKDSETITILRKGTFWTEGFSSKRIDLQKLEITRRGFLIVKNQKFSIIMDCDNLEEVKHFIMS